MSVMIRGNAAGNKASWQWLIPDEDEEAHQNHIWACCPESRAAWHVRGSLRHPDCWNSRRSISHFSMGVEIVNSQKTGDKFSDWQIQEAANIVRYLWSSPKYPNFNTVISHARIDPTRRTDPGVNFDWEALRHYIWSGGIWSGRQFAEPLIPLETPNDRDCIMDSRLRERKRWFR